MAGVLLSPLAPLPSTAELQPQQEPFLQLKSSALASPHLDLLETFVSAVFSHHPGINPRAISASNGVNRGFSKASPQSIERRGHAICIQASTASPNSAILAGEISDINTTVQLNPFSAIRFCSRSRILGFPCRPSVPRTIPQLLASLARKMALLRTSFIPV